MIETFWRDLKYAARTLRKSPGFVAIAVITLALGIGANTAIFSVVHGVLLAPLPYHQPDRLMIVWQNNPQGRHISPSYPDFQEWQRGTRSFEGMAAFGWRAYNCTYPGAPEHLDGWQISAGFFKTLGVRLKLGRDFSVEENRRGGAAVAIISERVWKERFAGSQAALGKMITMDGADYTIVGVAPPGINLGGTIDVYTPVEQGDPLIFNDRRTHAFIAIGRLKEGTSRAQALADTNAIEKRLGELYPKFDGGLSADVMPLKLAVVEDVRGTVLVLFGAVGLVLLIACANVASLLLARAAGREREFAIRAALGAQRIRIVWQMIAESVLLSLAGGGLGLLLAGACIRPLVAAAPGDFPRENIGLNPLVLLFTFAVSVVVGVIFGLLPALRTWNANQQPALRAGGRGSTAMHHRMQSGLVIAQTALTLVLLAGAGLLFRTIHQLLSVDPGFNTHQLVEFKAAIPPELSRSPQTMRNAYRQLIARIQEIPGVQSADLTTLTPLSGNDNELPFWIGLEEPRSIVEAPRTLTYSVGPDYFRTMGIPLLRGRSFTAADTEHSEPVAVIDSAFAETYFPGKNPVGQSFTLARVGQFRVIGVVGHVRHWGMDKTGPYNAVQAYTSYYQISDEWLPAMHTLTTIMVRTQLDTATLMPVVKAAVYGSGGAQPIYDVHTMREAVSTSMAAQSFPMMLLAAFAGLALLLAAIGMYGLLANFVQRRTQEIGVRMALGAQQADVFRMVIGQGLRLAAAGITIGVAAALAFTRFLTSFSSLLYGVKGNDPATLAVVACILTGVAVLACYVPARWATRVAPTEALRQE